MNQYHISEQLIDSISNVLYKIKYNVNFNRGILEVSPTAETPDNFALVALDIIDIIEDSLPHWPHSKSYEARINEDFAGCILDDIKKVLDDLNVPKGTYSDEQFYNFVVMYNNRGKYLEGLEKQINSSSADETVSALQEQVNALKHVLTEITKWPEHKTALTEIKAVVASMCC